MPCAGRQESCQGSSSR